MVDPRNEFSIQPRQKSQDYPQLLDHVLARAEEQPESADLYRELVAVHTQALRGQEGFDSPEASRQFWAREDELAQARARVGAAVCQSPKALSDLAGKSPELIDAVMADRQAAQGVDIDTNRLAELVSQPRTVGGGVVNETFEGMGDPAALGDPVKGFAAADAQYRSLLLHPTQNDPETGTPITNASDLAQLRAYRKAASEQIMANPLQAVQLGAERPDLLASVQGLSGQDGAAPQQVRGGLPRFRDGMRVEPSSDIQVVSDYAGADGRAAEAARKNDWDAYAKAVGERKELAQEMAGRPSALALAGQDLAREGDKRQTSMTNGAGARLRADLEEIQSAKQDQAARDESYEEFRQRFVDQSGQKDPVELYASVSEAQRQAQLYAGPPPLPGADSGKPFAELTDDPESWRDPVKDRLNGTAGVAGAPVAGESQTAPSALLGTQAKVPDFTNQHHLDRLSQELSGEIFQSPRDVQELHKHHPELAGKAAQEAESMLQSRAPEAEAAVVDRAEKAPVVDGAGEVSREEKAAADVAQERSDAQNTPQKGVLDERWQRARVANANAVRDYFYETERDESGRTHVARDGNGRPKMRDLSQTKDALALPVNAFGGGAGQISRALAKHQTGRKDKKELKKNTEFHNLSGQEVRQLYHNTVSLRNEISEKARKNPHARQVAHDELEMGRRALAVEMVERGLAQPEEIVKDAHRFQSPEARHFAKNAPHLARDPQGAIREGDLNKRKEVLRKGREAMAQQAKQGLKEGTEATKRHVGGFVNQAFDEMIN